MFVTRPVNFVLTGYLASTPSPRVSFELLHAKGNALGLGIEADHLDVDRLADLQGIRRMVDPAPRDVGHVQQAVDATEIDEGTVVRDVLDHAFEHLPLVQVGDQLVALLGTGVLQHGAAGDHDIPAAAIHLEDLERLIGADQGRNVAHRADIDLTARQKRHGAIEINREAALDPAEDDPGNPLAILVGLLQLLPGLLAARPLAAERGLAARGLEALDIDLDLVAHLHLGRLPRRGELLERHAALHLQSDIDQGGVVLDCENGALDHASLEARRVVQE